MRVVLVGNGGREAALAWRISRSPTLEALVVTGDNPGWPEAARHVPAEAVEAIGAVAAEVRADLVVAGPEAPLAAGLADHLATRGIPCFGPVAAAARLEASKAFAKDVMRAAGVPTAGAVIARRGDATSIEAARRRCRAGEVVVKADGLAAGKGVIVCRTAAEAHEALDHMLGDRFGAAADQIVLEDRLEGPELSLFALCDGTRAVALPSSQDHKTLLDGGRGPNTGGMGAYAPCPLVDDVAGEALVAQVHQPVVDEMARRGTPFRGVLFAGLMLTPQGPKVLEYNVRFGDPECQPLMCLWEEDVLPWLHGAAIGRLPAGRPQFARGAACCVVLAAAGYPDVVEKGRVIPEPAPAPGVRVFFAGARRDPGGVLRSNGGRVLGITGVGPDLITARARAYAALPGWRFEGAQFRSDIAASSVQPA